MDGGGYDGAKRLFVDYAGDIEQDKPRAAGEGERGYGVKSLPCVAGDTWQACKCNESLIKRADL